MLLERSISKGWIWAKLRAKQCYKTWVLVVEVKGGWGRNILAVLGRCGKGGSTESFCTTINILLQQLFCPSSTIAELPNVKLLGLVLTPLQEASARNQTNQQQRRAVKLRSHQLHSSHSSHWPACCVAAGINCIDCSRRLQKLCSLTPADGNLHNSSVRMTSQPTTKPNDDIIMDGCPHSRDSTQPHSPGLAALANKMKYSLLSRASLRCD